MKHHHILFIGGGNMTRALVSGLIQEGTPPSSLYVVDHHPEKQAALSQTFQIHTGGTPSLFFDQAALVILAVKPQHAEALCHTLHPLFKKHTPLVLSVMAGLSIQALQTWLGAHTQIVRAMPNTPVMIKAGATGLYASPELPQAKRNQAEEVMRSVGLTAWVDQESDLEIITALSGSGPAYYFYFMELMQDIAIKMGLPQKIAKLFAIETAYGASKLALESETDLLTLRAAVTSKGGTTEAALNTMQQKNLSGLLEEAMEACRVHSQKLNERLAPPKQLHQEEPTS